ncbi:hypothetical protein AJ80_06778 [Polytolypa hystricis UAMH7299]|uniref:4-coumarate-CoA ligase n=1 Tax=Polytolypa hystricis (strain UAMH7299) TaxID=1447883 RepID=A0A2B7XKI9_POLH7|nr:hypothetical protein AJ80_06778 [Polytolypa hystricis UAMH7299]
MLFGSARPDVNPPTGLTVWEWLFEAKESSSLHHVPSHEITGYTNAVTKERINWAQVKEAATYVSTALVRKYGMQETQTVALFTQNTVWYPVAMFATIRAGGKVAGASPAYNVEEMTYALKVSDAKFLITGKASLEVAIAAAKNAGIPQSHVFLFDGEAEGITTFKQLQEIGKSYGEEGQIPVYSIPAGKTNTDICGFLNFSSGTTGLFKAVMLSHYNVIAQCLQMKEITPVEPKTFLAVLPLYHITGLIRFCTNPIFQNDEVILLPQFTMPLVLSAITTYHITELILVPPIAIRFANDPVVAKHNLSSVKRISCGAAPLSKEVTHSLAAKFPLAGFRQGYGMTESTGCLTTHFPEFYSYDYANTVGNIVPSTVIKIIDESGRQLDYNQTGEILARGPQIAMGYLGNENATAESFDKDGFFHTGDIGSINESGLVSIVDRIKEMIKVKGIAVAPAELEDLLLAHPRVADCAVVGVVDDYAGERPKAYVVLKEDDDEGGGLPSRELGLKIMKFVKERKVRFKWVREIEFVHAVPKSPSGKILRKVLRMQERERRESGKVVEGGLIVRDEEGERARL